MTISIDPWSVQVTTPSVSRAAAAAVFSFTVDNRGPEVRVPLSLDIRHSDGTSSGSSVWDAPLKPGLTQFTRQVELTQPLLWSPEHPALYTASITAGGDCEQVRFGVRSISVCPKEGLLLNGLPLKLRGGCVHHDNGPLGACAFPEAEERKIAKLKEAGYNAIRSAHNPPSRALLDACDRLGMLVMDEVFDGWREGKTPGERRRPFDRLWRAELRATVCRDRNHPSVFCYSIGNEVLERCRPAGAELAREMSDEVRRLDPTRPVTCGVNGTFVEGGRYQGLLSNLLNGEGAVQGTLPEEVREALRRAGEQPQDWGALTADLIAPLDIAGYNYLDFRYQGDRRRFPHRVICGTESFPKLMDSVWRRTLPCRHVIGDFTWAAWDYLGESGIGRAFYGQPYQMFSDYPYHLATCGDFDICGHMRPQGYMRRILWGMETRPAVLVLPPRLFSLPETVTAWGWPAVEASWTFPGQEDRPVRVEVYSNAEQVELWLNGTRLGCAPVEECRAVFQVRYHPGVLRAVNVRQGRPAEDCVLETTGAPAHVALCPEGDAFCTGGAAAYVWAEVQDEAGRRVPWADHELICTVQGPVQILASGSGDPEDVHCYTAPVCRAYHGKALFILRREALPGPAAVRISAPGLGTAECTWDVSCK